MDIVGTDANMGRPTPKYKTDLNRRRTLLFTVAGMIGAAAQLRRARAESLPLAEHRMASASERTATDLVPDLKTAGTQSQVRAIHQHAGTFEIMTADRHSRVFQEADLRFKIDTSEKGPMPGRPIILSGGMKGDRATVFFASPTEIGLLINHQG